MELLFVQFPPFGYYLDWTRVPSGVTIRWEGAECRELIRPQHITQVSLNGQAVEWRPIYR